MKILITGNMGYVGPALTRHLRHVMPQTTLLGYDNGYFGHCLTRLDVFPERRLDAQYFGDMRAFPAELLDGVDSVVHLSAVSNDPMGNRFETVTDDINHSASLRLAEMARDRGVNSFVFASSCSMYGAAEDGPRKESDSVNPLTTYARSKNATEEGLASMDLGDMTVTALRFATACGMSDRLRLDLVLNDFVACALTSKVVTVLSDGSPWRPLIDVRDMARAIEWAATRSREQGGQLVRVNTGSDVWNYQVKDLANAVAEAVSGTRVSINTDAPPDKRSYSVDFSMFKSLAPSHLPQVTLEQSIAGLCEGLTELGFTDANFRNSEFMRLKVLEGHMSAGRLSEDLRWTSAAA